MNEEKDVPITLGEKYMLTIREASIYFNIGVKKIRRLAEDNSRSILYLQWQQIFNNTS